MNEGERSSLNFTTDELDTLARLAEAQREIAEIAENLYWGKTSKRDDRRQKARRLHRISSSLKTIELRLGEETT